MDRTNTYSETKNIWTYRDNNSENKGIYSEFSEDKKPQLALPITYIFIRRKGRINMRRKGGDEETF
ncbi:hypothetical protein V1478_005182 [Vespula squamosa]|uniref:Uncharacterized protein n=1 Tax=Vespula squamosa TaxID=30214 RepID=A0ABD2BDK5_VESSQ